MASKLRLSFAIRKTPRVRALVEGEVNPEGIDLVTSTLPPPDIFWRQFKFGDFEVSEMSLSSLLMAVANGDTTWKALPIFPDRRFFHSRIMVRADAGIERPEDLRGKRIGVPDYQMTAALWGRGALQHEFGVQPTDVTWFQERAADFSHAEALSFSPPPGVRIEHVPSHTTTGEMLASGDLDAAIHYVRYRTMIDRSAADPDPANVTYLFSDRNAERARYYKSLGFIPMNHCVAIRSDVLEANPWIAINLYAAFVASKEVERERAAESNALSIEAGLVSEESVAGLAVDLFPYGVKANASALSTLTQYSYEQGLSKRLVDPSEIFAESVSEF